MVISSGAIIADNRSPISESRLRNIIRELPIEVWANDAEVPVSSVQVNPCDEAPGVRIELGFDYRDLGSHPHQVRVHSRNVMFIGGAASNVAFPQGALTVYRLKIPGAFVSLSIHTPAK